MFSKMPRKRKQELPPILAASEPFGERLSAMRQQRGLTQAQLAELVGVTQPLVSDYERGRLQLSADMAVRFALALKVSSDELLGLKVPTDGGKKPSRRVLKRLEQIEALPEYDQRTLLRTIDGFLKGAA